MQLEKEIHQKKFKSEHTKAALNVLFTASWISLRYTQFFRRFSLTTPQFNVLRILRGQHPKPATISLITERMLDRTSNASRIVDKLVQKGLVDRRVCPSDRRSVDVLINDAGLALLKELDAHEHEFEKQTIALTRQEAEELNRLLDKLRD